MGISLLSIDQARENLNTQISNSNFEDIKSQSFELWESYLSTVQIQSDSILDTSKFYTFLYRSFNAPVLFFYFLI